MCTQGRWRYKFLMELAITGKSVQQSLVGFLTPIHFQAIICRYLMHGAPRWISPASPAKFIETESCCHFHLVQSHLSRGRSHIPLQLFANLTSTDKTVFLSISKRPQCNQRKKYHSPFTAKCGLKPIRQFWLTPQTHMFLLDCKTRCPTIMG